MQYTDSEDFRSGMRVASGIRGKMIPRSFKIIPYESNGTTSYALRINNTYIGRFRSMEMGRGVVFGLLLRNGGLHRGVSFDWVTDLTEGGSTTVLEFTLVEEGLPGAVNDYIIDEGGPSSSYATIIDEGESDTIIDGEEILDGIYFGGDPEDL